MTTNQALKHLNSLRVQDYESILIIGLDDNKKYLFIKDLSKKNKENGASINLYEVAEECHKNKCHNIIMAHNHPYEVLPYAKIENVQPSKDDLELTDFSRVYLDLRGVKLEDHIIVSPNLHCSIFNYLKTKEYPEHIIHWGQNELRNIKNYL